MYWPDEPGLLAFGYDGSSYSNILSTIVYLERSEVSTSWAAKELKLPTLLSNSEKVMRAEAEKVGLKLPKEPASWILWPHEG